MIEHNPMLADKDFKEMQKHKNSKMPKPAIHISGRRWFQRTYGNTYHSVNVYVAGKLLDCVEFEYGYGDCYLQTALDLLKKHGIVEGDFPYGSFALRENLGATWEVVDVQRKKDL